jgi:hypothetical protein
MSGLFYWLFALNRGAALEPLRDEGVGRKNQPGGLVGGGPNSHT